MFHLARNQSCVFKNISFPQLYLYVVYKLRTRPAEKDEVIQSTKIEELSRWNSQKNMHSVMSDE